MAAQLALFETDRLVSMTELRELWTELTARGELWNGMTEHYLRERYGDRLYHAPGGGWGVRPASWGPCGTCGQIRNPEHAVLCFGAARD